MAHEEFEKICASASLGKATAEDLVRLERHVLVCSSCWQAYHDDVSAAAYEFAAVAQDPTLSPKEAKECLDSELFMRRWFDRAEREGIAFSEEVRRPADRRRADRIFLKTGLGMEGICNTGGGCSVRGVGAFYRVSAVAEHTESPGVEGVDRKLSRRRRSPSVLRNWWKLIKP